MSDDKRLTRGEAVFIQAWRDGHIAAETIEQIRLGLQGKIRLEADSVALKWLVAVEVLDRLPPPEQSKGKES